VVLKVKAAIFGFFFILILGSAEVIGINIQQGQQAWDNGWPGAVESQSALAGQLAAGQIKELGTTLTVAQQGSFIGNACPADSAMLALGQDGARYLVFFTDCGTFSQAAPLGNEVNAFRHNLEQQGYGPLFTQGQNDPLMAQFAQAVGSHRKI